MDDFNIFKQSLKGRKGVQENIFGRDIGLRFNTYQNSKKKKVQLTPKERLYVWEHPKLYGRNCHICEQKITKMSELELDHIIPYVKGGQKMNLAHRDCNRMKGSKNLKDVKKKMIFKTNINKQNKPLKNKPNRNKQNKNSFDGSLFGQPIKRSRDNLFGL